MMTIFNKNLMRSLIVTLLIVTLGCFASGCGGGAGTGSPSSSGSSSGGETTDRFLAGGFFSSVNGYERNHVARLGSNGALDTSFDPGQGADADVSSIALQPDGKILIGGSFTSYRGVSINCIARLNTDGTLDTSFNPGTGADNTVSAVAVQADGKILIGGSFTSFNGAPVNFITRLNANGTLDGTFNTGTGADAPVDCIVVQGDGKILIGGDFTDYDGTGIGYIIRLNADGSPDPGFVPPIPGADGRVFSIALQGDGKILIGGSFQNYGAALSPSIARLSANGTLDDTFNPGTGADSTIDCLALQGDGRIVIGGEFTDYNGTPLIHIGRVNADGTVDGTFNTGTGTDASPDSLTLQNDGKILMGGCFSDYNGTALWHIARLGADGSVDATFDTGTGASDNVASIVIQGDGKILMGGSFTIANGTQRNSITSYNNNGSVDTTFNPGTGVDGFVNSMAKSRDGLIYIVGWFGSYNGVPRNSIVRLAPDGSLDTGFDPGVGVNGYITCLTLQRDGKILIGGSFDTCDDVARNNIARLNTDGTLDASFDPGTGTDGPVCSFALRGDDSIYVGGEFTAYNDTPRSCIARLNVDGTLDTGFDPGTGADGVVDTMAMQTDEKIILGGDFGTYNGTARSCIARINPGGTLDTGFDPGTGADLVILGTALQGDGRILIGGWFDNYNDVTQGKIARINTDGSLDTSFNPGTSVDGYVQCITIQRDGKILIGGAFTQYNGALTDSIVRLNTDGSLDTSFNAGIGLGNIMNSILIW